MDGTSTLGAFLLALLAAASQTAPRWFAFPLPVFQYCIQAHPARLQAGSCDVSRPRPTHYDPPLPLKQACVAFAVLCLAVFICQYFCSLWLNLCSLRCRFLFCLPVCTFRHLLYFTVSSCWLSAVFLIRYCWWKPNISCFCSFHNKSFYITSNGKLLLWRIYYQSVYYRIHGAAALQKCSEK